MASCKLVSFHVCLHSFQCTPTRITDLVRPVSDEKIYHCRIWNSQSPMSMFLLLSVWFVSVTHTANEYSIYHFFILVKDFSISFSRVIITQDFETVIFMYYLDTNGDTNRLLLFSVE